jgi:hypothetical protein
MVSHSRISYVILTWLHTVRLTYDFRGLCLRRITNYKENVKLLFCLSSAPGKFMDEGKLPDILNLGTCWRQWVVSGCFSPGEQTLETHWVIFGWVLEQVWHLRWKKNPSLESNPGHLTSSQSFTDSAMPAWRSDSKISVKLISAILRVWRSWSQKPQN